MARYRVTPGQTLSGILQSLGNPNYASPEEWAKVKTRSGNPNLIYPGEELELPEQITPQQEQISQLNQEMTPIIQERVQAPITTPSASSTSTDTMTLILKYFPQEQWQNAYNVMMGESGGRADAIGDNFPIDTGRGPEIIPSYGLFQIRGLPGRPASDQLINPEFNVKYAADLWRQEGWRPWTAAKKLGLL